MNKPDFIGIGMERSGSSWLFYMLAAHPQIWVPPIKELHYFDAADLRYNRHLKSRLSTKTAPLFKSTAQRPQYFKNTFAEYLAWDVRYFTGKKSDDWYAALFADQFTKGRVCGEVTASYAAMPEDKIAALAKKFGNAKIILSLRDPAERTISAMFHDLRGIRRLKPEQITGAAMLDWLEKYAQRGEPDRAEIMARWQKYIRPENLLLVSFTEIASFPETLITRLYQTLGVDPVFRPPLQRLHEKIFSFRDEAEQLPPAVLEAVHALHNTENDLTVFRRAKKS